jgi:hypothetical protein
MSRVFRSASATDYTTLRRSELTARLAVSPERAERKLAADVAGYSRLMGAGEEGTLSRLKTLRRQVWESHNGHVF